MNASPSIKRAADIERALAKLHIDGLCIDVINDRVYLQGVAACYDHKRQAGRLAAALAPGAFIENEIRVSQAGDCNDADLLQEMADAIAARAGRRTVARLTLEATVGAVVIRGVARDARERRAIEQAAWEASRARRIESHIAIDAIVIPDTDVGEALNRYVERAMNVAPGSILVRYAAGVASLAGVVPSVNQSQAIEDLVRWHDQVTDVVNGLVVTAPSVVTRSAPTAL